MKKTNTMQLKMEAEETKILLRIIHSPLKTDLLNYSTYSMVGKGTKMHVIQSQKQQISS